MNSENSSDGFSKEKAELFDALGHPTRIKILESLSNSPKSFSDLKKDLNIESSGLMQFHLGKLQGLIKTISDGSYVLTDEGREALRVITRKNLNDPSSQKLSKKKKYAILLTALIIVASIGIVATFIVPVQHNDLIWQASHSLGLGESESIPVHVPYGASNVFLHYQYNIHDSNNSNLASSFETVIGLDRGSTIPGIPGFEPLQIDVPIANSTGLGEIQTIYTNSSGNVIIPISADETHYPIWITYWSIKADEYDTVYINEVVYLSYTAPLLSGTFTFNY
jgi:DNA-binding transcriptional ArsR family regulator